MKPAVRYPLPNPLFRYLMADEGGDRVTDDPLDPGGLTKYGISQRAYPHEDIRNLTEERARFLYERDYWQKSYIDQLPRGLDYAVFDYAVNSGAKRAVRALQELIGIDPDLCDGILGDRTLAAVRSFCGANGKPLAITAYCNKRASWLIALNKPRYIKGWLARVDRVRERAKEWISA